MPTAALEAVLNLTTPENAYRIDTFGATKGVQSYVSLAKSPIKHQMALMSSRTTTLGGSLNFNLNDDPLLPLSWITKISVRLEVADLQ